MNTIIYRSYLNTIVQNVSITQRHVYRENRGVRALDRNIANIDEIKSDNCHMNLVDQADRRWVKIFLMRGTWDTWYIIYLNYIVDVMILNGLWCLPVAIEKKQSKVRRTCLSYLVQHSSRMVIIHKINKATKSLRRTSLAFELYLLTKVHTFHMFDDPIRWEKTIKQERSVYKKLKTL